MCMNESYCIVNRIIFNKIQFSTKIIGGMLKKLIKYLAYPL